MCLIQVANTVIEHGYAKLSEVFRLVFPNISYWSNTAKKKLLKILRVGNPSSGVSETYLIVGIISLTISKITILLLPLLSHDCHLMSYHCDQSNQHRLRICLMCA